MKRGARGPVRGWLQRDIERPYSPPPTSPPVRENGRLRGNTDAQRRKRRDLDGTGSAGSPCGTPRA